MNTLQQLQHLSEISCSNRTGIQTMHLQTHLTSHRCARESVVRRNCTQFSKSVIVTQNFTLTNTHWHTHTSGSTLSILSYVYTTHTHTHTHPPDGTHNSGSQFRQPLVLILLCVIAIAIRVCMCVLTPGEQTVAVCYPSTCIKRTRNELENKLCPESTHTWLAERRKQNNPRFLPATQAHRRPCPGICSLRAIISLWVCVCVPVRVCVCLQCKHITGTGFLPRWKVYMRFSLQSWRSITLCHVPAGGPGPGPEFPRTSELPSLKGWPETDIRLPWGEAAFYDWKLRINFHTLSSNCLLWTTLGGEIAIYATHTTIQPPKVGNGNLRWPVLLTDAWFACGLQ